MNPDLGALARFCLGFVALLIGFDQPELEFALRAALADSSDRGAADQVEGLRRQHRKDFGDHGRLVEPALQVLRGAPLGPTEARLLADTALHTMQTSGSSFSWGPALRGSALASAVSRAYAASQRQDGAALVRAFEGQDLDDAGPEVAAVIRAILAVYGGAAADPWRSASSDPWAPSAATDPWGSSHGGSRGAAADPWGSAPAGRTRGSRASRARDRGVTERMPASSARRPPPDLDLNRGRASRADLALALLHARRVTLLDVETGRVFKVSAAGRLDVVEALLRDPFWDDIDASVQEPGVVAGVLRGQPSPAIDMRRAGLGQVAIKEISA